MRTTHGHAHDFARFSLVALTMLGGAASHVAANSPPVADAGADRYLNAAIAYIDGTGSYDPDPGDELAFAWTQVSGPVVTITDADAPVASVQAVQTGVVQTAVLRLAVGDSQASSSDDVTLTIVPEDTAGNIPSLSNTSFDPGKPTIVNFGGGDCHSGGGGNIYWSAWLDRTNVIYFVDYEPPYTSCADAVICMLSQFAPEYDMPIQTQGFSTGGMPAIDVANHLNSVYGDPRYAVNQVVFLDAACRDYEATVRQFVENPVADEPAWVSNFYVHNAGYAEFCPRAVNIRMTGNHGTASSYYTTTMWPESLFTTDVYNHGLVAGVFTSVIEHGANYRIVPLYSSPYHFEWIENPDYTGQMQYHWHDDYPGAMIEPVELIGPADGAEVAAAGVTLSCPASEHAIWYELRMGPSRDQLRLMYSLNNPMAISTGRLRPGTEYFWTIEAFDVFGSSYRADVQRFTTPAGVDGDLDGDGLLDATDCTLMHAAAGSVIGEPAYIMGADDDLDGFVGCNDVAAWLAKYRAFVGDPNATDSCGLENPADSDGDGIADVCDHCPSPDVSDDDEDDIPVPCDNCPDVFNRDQIDTDADGLGNACDACPLDPDNDADEDGLCADVDNCPAVANADQADLDGDGIGDVCDPDIDDDTILNEDDNCVTSVNTDQADEDNDGVGDACDDCLGTVEGRPVDAVGCAIPIPGDLDADWDVDQADFGKLQACLTGSFAPQVEPACQGTLLDDDNDTDQADVVLFIQCWTGPNVIGNPDCLAP